jgi:cytochrome c-type biogenesis protein CcmH/NrfG
LLNEVKVQSAINMACLDRHEEAIRALKDSLNLEQPDGALWFYLGHSEIALKRFTDSLLSLREAARRGVPKNLEPNFTMI